MKVEHAATNETLKWFEEITKIPRCSKNEEKIAQWLMQWAQTHHFPAKMDRVKNIVISIPATPGNEKAPIVVLQGHMDMVCEKTPDSTHDFSRDAIKLLYDGEWLKADRTTLGADNGIAIAMAMALALDPGIERPPLELLFTVDEETGLTGANALEPGFIKGKILINLDSEDEGVFTVGCAGGMNTRSSIPLKYETLTADFQPVRITASGMKGGHSGVDIAKGKANAIIVLARILQAIRKEKVAVRISDITGGSAHNAIPRDCSAIVFIPIKHRDRVTRIIAGAEQTFRNEFKNTDPDIKISIDEAGTDKNRQALTDMDNQKVIDYMLVMPHGVAAMSTEIASLVETSNNFANIKIEGNTLNILTSQRSSVVSRLKAHTARIEALTRLADGEAETGDGYPPWQPNMTSPLLDKCIKLYEQMFQKKPVVEVIHAGLECGIIGDKNPGMDMISIGPNLKNPHSPDEKIHIGSIGKVWDFVVALLASFNAPDKPLA